MAKKVSSPSKKLSKAIVRAGKRNPVTRAAKADAKAKKKADTAALAALKVVESAVDKPFTPSA